LGEEDDDAGRNGLPFLNPFVITDEAAPVKAPTAPATRTSLRLAWLRPGAIAREASALTPAPTSPPMPPAAAALAQPVPKALPTP
jgi:hypothetical protein